MSSASPLPKPATAPRLAEHIPCYDARDMLGDSPQARITLDNQSYVLRITRAGKLILTK